MSTVCFINFNHLFFSYDFSEVFSLGLTRNKALTFPLKPVLVKISLELHHVSLVR